MNMTRSLPPEQILATESQPPIMLHRAGAADAESVVDATLDSMDELRPFMAWSHSAENNTLAAQQKRLTAAEASWSAGEEFLWHIFIEVDTQWRFAGCIGIRARCVHPKGMDVGYWVRSEAAGQGLCTLACQILTVVGFESVQLERRQIGCDEANIGSRRVIEKVGFCFEGRKRKELPSPTDEMRERGSLGTGNILSFALTDDDIGSLEWYPDMRARMECVQ